MNLLQYGRCSLGTGHECSGGLSMMSHLSSGFLTGTVCPTWSIATLRTNDHGPFSGLMTFKTCGEKVTSESKTLVEEVTHGHKLNLEVTWHKITMQSTKTSEYSGLESLRWINMGQSMCENLSKCDVNGCSLVMKRMLWGFSRALTFSDVYPFSLKVEQRVTFDTALFSSLLLSSPALHSLPALCLQSIHRWRGWPQVNLGAFSQGTHGPNNLLLHTHSLFSAVSFPAVCAFSPFSPSLLLSPPRCPAVSILAWIYRLL